MIRYRFSEFTLSPQRRLLVRNGRDVALIPRYFDLLLLLIERRREAVHRRDIFERVWADVIVSDSALSQAIRTIRSTLGDDSREPRFIRTVSRHGYQFVFPDVIEEEENDALPSPSPSLPSTPESPAIAPTPPLVAAVSGEDDDVIETWGRRWQRAARLAATRCTGASIGSALAGVAAGALGGLVLAAAPGSTATIAIAPVLALIGGACGAVGGAGVGAGLTLAEATSRLYRPLALTVAAAIGGGLVGASAQWLSRWSLDALVGIHLSVGGGLEGIVIGAAAGLGFAIATRSTEAGLAAPRGRKRWQAAMVTALCCGLAGLALTVAGRPLVSGTINAIAHAAGGSRAQLEPLGHLIGEPDFGPVTAAILAFGETALFGLGLTYGLMRRPAHANLT